MNKKILIVISIFFNILFSQHIIESKQFEYYINEDSIKIDIFKLINESSGLYEVQLLNVKDLEYQKHKVIIMEKCEFRLNVKSDLSNELINFNICNDKIENRHSLYVDNENPSIYINTDKYKTLTATLVLKISGIYTKSTGSYNINNNGILREWYDSGALFLEYNMTNGIKDGICKRWYENGQIDILYNYNKGRLSGTQKKWYPNGSKRGEWNYIEDRLHGLSTEWYDNGEIKSIKEYEYDVLIEEVLYNKDYE